MKFPNSIPMKKTHSPSHSVSCKAARLKDLAVGPVGL